MIPQDILNDMDSDTLPETTVTAQPVISDEDYQRLAVLRNTIIALKADKSDIADAIEARKLALQEAEDALLSVKTQIEENAKKLQETLDEVIGPLGLEGQFQIADDSPHYVTPMSAQQ